MENSFISKWHRYKILLIIIKSNIISTWIKIFSIITEYEFGDPLILKEY